MDPCLASHWYDKLCDLRERWDPAEDEPSEARLRTLRTILSSALVRNKPYRDGRQAAVKPRPTCFHNALVYSVRRENCPPTVSLRLGLAWLTLAVDIAFGYVFSVEWLNIYNHSRDWCFDGTSRCQLGYYNLSYGGVDLEQIQRKFARDTNLAGRWHVQRPDLSFGLANKLLYHLGIQQRHIKGIGNSRIATSKQKSDIAYPRCSRVELLQYSFSLASDVQ